MPTNDELATLLEEMADLLEATDVEYKPTAYRRAAENVREYPEPVEELAESGEDAVAEINRVGDAIAAKLVEYVETGEIEELEELREELPVDMAALTSVEGVGPKTVGTLYEELGVTDLDDLEDAARNGEIREVSGFGPKTEQNILDGIDFARQAHQRTLLGTGRPLGEAAREFLAGIDAVEAAELAGSNRRWKETIGDVDVLAASTDGEAVVDARCMSYCRAKSLGIDHVSKVTRITTHSWPKLMFTSSTSGRSRISRPIGVSSASRSSGAPSASNSDIEFIAHPPVGRSAVSRPPRSTAAKLPPRRRRNTKDRCHSHRCRDTYRTRRSSLSPHDQILLFVVPLLADFKPGVM